MSLSKGLIAGALGALSLAGASTDASAQYYYQQPSPYYRYQPQYQPPVYVPPRIARKQAQLSERFVEKYGYQPVPRPRYYQRPDAYYYPPQYPAPGYWQGRPHRQAPYYGTTTPGGW